MWNWRGLLAGLVVVLVGVGVVSAQQQPTPAPTTTTTTTTTTTVPPEGLDRWVVPAADNTCERLNAATAGDTIVLDDGRLADVTGGGTSKDFACDVRGQKAPGVTVSGSWSGDLQCHGCDGWIFDKIVVRPGSLRMIGGRDWTISNAVVHGGNRGLMAVVGTGSTDAADVAVKSPTGWRMTNVDAGGAGCRPAGDPFPSHVRAVYINGKNGADNKAIISGSRFWGAGCGYTAKIGATGNFGAMSNAADAADGVAFVGNVVEQTDDVLPEGVPEQRIPLLVSGNSDGVVVRDNTLIGGVKWAVSASGPFTGAGFVFENNRIGSTPNMILWRRYTGFLLNETFVTYPLAGVGCSPLGTCSGNTRG